MDDDDLDTVLMLGIVVVAVLTICMLWGIV